MIQTGAVQQEFPLGTRKTPDPNWWDKYGPVVAKALEAIGQIVGGYFGGPIGGKFGAEGGKNQGDILSRVFRNQPEVMEHYKRYGYDDSIKVGGQSGRGQASERLKGRVQEGTRKWAKNIPKSGVLTPQQKEYMPGESYYEQRPLGIFGEGKADTVQIQPPRQAAKGDTSQQFIDLIQAIMQQDQGGQGGMMGMIQQIMGGMGGGQGGGATAGPSFMDYMGSMQSY